MPNGLSAEVIIVGAGLAGLSAAIYLGRARRETLVIDYDKSMAKWEPDVQNYLGFPKGIGGAELLRRGRDQAEGDKIRFKKDKIKWARARKNGFSLRGEHRQYSCRRLLLCTGIFHLPPEIPSLLPCLGHSMFFCKDCDGLRVQGKPVGIYGYSNDTVEYALGMLFYSPCVVIITDGKKNLWDKRRARWIEEYKIPVYQKRILGVQREMRNVRSLRFMDGKEVELAGLFVTRGDIYYNKLAKGLGAKVDEDGQIMVDLCMRTTVKGVYAAGCVTPANCQMIIAAGQGASAAQAINRDLFEESLATHSLRRFRVKQLKTRRTKPVVKKVTVKPSNSNADCHTQNAAKPHS
jgi:thioredoxin reductase (NADPH)